MSTLNCNVTPGKVFTEDLQGKALVTLDGLNQTANPTVTANLSNAVAAEDLKASAVELAKLAPETAQRIQAAVATVGAEATNVVTVTVQVTDAQGNNLSAQAVFDFWLSTAAGAARGGTAPTGGVAATTGVIVDSFTTTMHARVITNSSGRAVLTFTDSGAKTLYFNAVVNGRYVAGSQSMSWT